MSDDPIGWIARLPGVYPAVSALHVLAIALLVGPVLLVDLTGLGVLRAPGLTAAIPTLLKTARRGLGLAAVTGLALFLVQPTGYLQMWTFLAKMGVVTLGALNGLSWSFKTVEGPPPAWRCALSIGAWIAAVFLGRWIGFQ